MVARIVSVSVLWPVVYCSCGICGGVISDASVAVVPMALVPSMSMAAGGIRTPA